MSLHSACDQVSVDDLTTALACIALVDGTGPNLVAAHPAVTPDIRHGQALGAARLLWASEADRALMRAERGRCFDL
jgi:hypothetical protein